MQANLSSVKKVHFIGIGGIGISAVAKMMIAEGKMVTGSDLNSSEITEAFSDAGISIKIGQGIDFIPKDSDLIIYTAVLDVSDQKKKKKIKVP
ncbi:UDP-N-acetylmuramate--L-alanine ligase, partial [Candidatus Parcubacteria bacterium]|nr:UDP-N-acetylmuramate--L-alanine ligase [Candidatus Parcubacteria bacterium]